MFEHSQNVQIHDGTFTAAGRDNNHRNTGPGMITEGSTVGHGGSANVNVYLHNRPQRQRGTISPVCSIIYVPYSSRRYHSVDHPWR
jgi:hypothetical protein